MFWKTAITLFLVPFFATYVAAQCARQYTVQSGDFCDKISAANKSPTDQLMKANKPAVNDLCSNLKPGQVICLGLTGSDCQDIYVVKPNDTLDGVASSTGVDSKTLYTNNPQIKREKPLIYVGEVLCVAKTSKVAGGAGSGTSPDVPSGSATPASSLGGSSGLDALGGGSSPGSVTGSSASGSASAATVTKSTTSTIQPSEAATLIGSSESKSGGTTDLASLTDSTTGITDPELSGGDATAGELGGTGDAGGAPAAVGSASAGTGGATGAPSTVSPSPAKPAGAK